LWRLPEMWLIGVSSGLTQKQTLLHIMNICTLKTWNVL
jgi:hypothetical protein